MEGEGLQGGGDLDLLLRAEEAERRAMQHYERSQYILIRAFFQLVTVVFVIEHLPLQVIRDRAVSFILDFFFKTAMVLISTTILRKSYLINHHERMAEACRALIRSRLPPASPLALLAHQGEHRRGRLKRIFVPAVGRLALGYALLSFSIALSFTLSIA